MLNRKLYWVLLSIFNCLVSAGQITSNASHPLYQLDKELKSGNKNAFFEIAPYFDSRKELVERFAYNHISARTESEVAKRIVSVNSVFTGSEIQIDDSTSEKDFLDFLNKNAENISYSARANAFLITPLEARSVNIKFRDITNEKSLLLKKDYHEILNSIENPEIISLINKKDPESLFVIASELYKGRDWLNILEYHSKKEKYIRLLQVLTNLEFAVEDYKNQMTWHIEEEYNADAALNLLCYFAANYSAFEWNEEKMIFENKNIQILPIGKEHYLFQLLSSKNDTTALNAFIQLTTCDPETVTELAVEYENAGMVKNYAIPIFPYRFLKQLVLLTEYCRNNDIDFVGTEELKNNIFLLQSKLSFPERRKLEDQLISSLTLDNITAFEYWALIYEQSWGLTFSAGRILDIFYSRNWSNLISEKKYLDCYLKKSVLFDNLGIIGVCNNYLKKFSNSAPATLNLLKNYQTNDSCIIGQIEKIVSMNESPEKKANGTVSWEGNQDSGVKDLEKQLDKLMKNVQDSAKTDNAIAKILSQISYSQIPTALRAIDNYPFQTKWEKYSFMERDWGFFMAGDFDKKEVRDEFLDLYSKYSEYELYAYYLDIAYIDYKSADNMLDYDKIYELLKYDVVVAFVGGGGGALDNEVYSLVKLLELTFKTTLGYPDKLCNSNNMYYCDSDERAKAWMNFLYENNLLKIKHDEPVSFHYE